MAGLVTGVGVSSHDDAMQAVLEATETARRDCRAPSLVLALLSHAHPATALADVRDALRASFPGVTVAGAVVNGVVFDGVRHDAYYGARSLCILLLGGEALHLGVAQIPHPTDAVEGGKQLALLARRRLHRPSRGGVLFSPGLSKDPSIDSAILDGVREAIPGLRLSGTGCCGGLSLEGVPLPGSTFLDDTIEPRGALLLLFGDNLRLGFSDFRAPTGFTPPVPRRRSPTSAGRWSAPSTGGRPRTWCWTSWPRTAPSSVPSWPMHRRWPASKRASRSPRSGTGFTGCTCRRCSCPAG